MITYDPAEMKPRMAERARKMSYNDWSVPATVQEIQRGDWRELYSDNPADVIASVTLVPPANRYDAIPEGSDYTRCQIWDAESFLLDNTKVPYWSRPTCYITLTPYGQFVTDYRCLSGSADSDERCRRNPIGWWRGTVSCTLRAGRGFVGASTGSGAGTISLCVCDDATLRAMFADVLRQGDEVWRAEQAARAQPVA